MSVKLAPIGNNQIVDSSGAPLSGGLIYTYVAGSTTPQATYTAADGLTPQTQPVVLDTYGFPVGGQIWLSAGLSYRFDIKTPAGVLIKTEDNLSGINDTSVSIDQWLPSGLTPTFVSTTSFTLAGDQTAAFTVGRRLKTTNTGGTIYSRISASAYSSVTTVTVVNDSGTLDSGLSAVSYGLLTPTNTSAPVLTDAEFLISGSADQTKLVAFEVDGLTTGTKRTYTLQDSSDTLVGRATTDTLTNKTLTDAIANTQTANNNSTKVATTAYADANQNTLGTPQATTSGTSVSLSDIPAGVKAVRICFVGVSTNGTSPVILRVGPSGGVVSAGYLGGNGGINGSGVADSSTASTVGFIFDRPGASISASAVRHGTMTLTLENSSTNTWTMSATGFDTGTLIAFWAAGRIALSGALNKVTLTTVGGSDAFDAGEVNVNYQF